MSAPTRIAILAHSTNPRGGVVHAMQLAEALCDIGAEATLIAPDAEGSGFFRNPNCPSLAIPARREPDVAGMVRRRIAEIGRFLASGAAERFDLFHAQDPISANALADLVAAGRLRGFARTVHHLDRFTDRRLACWQQRGLAAARRVAVVSRLWQQRLAREHGIDATLVGNGVDAQRFSPQPDGREAVLRGHLGLAAGDGPVVLALGGIEARKNTRGLLQAFRLLAQDHPRARLVIAGGATLLDHGAYRRSFHDTLAGCGLASRVTLAGVIADADMPALYRLADLVACVSLEEGFGLCAIEAMASGRPVVVSDIAPFTEHLQRSWVAWADPRDPDATGAAMANALRPEIAARLGAAGPGHARGFGWRDVARAHLPFYAALAPRMELSLA